MEIEGEKQVRNLRILSCHARQTSLLGSFCCHPFLYLLLPHSFTWHQNRLMIEKRDIELQQREKKRAFCDTGMSTWEVQYCPICCIPRFAFIQVFHAPTPLLQQVRSHISSSVFVPIAPFFLSKKNVHGASRSFLPSAFALALLFVPVLALLSSLAPHLSLFLPSLFPWET